jgi:lipoprotein-anchoring transpeptidase ErfK/SrfK
VSAIGNHLRGTAVRRPRGPGHTPGARTAGSAWPAGPASLRRLAVLSTVAAASAAVVVSAAIVAMARPTAPHARQLTVTGAITAHGPAVAPPIARAGAVPVLAPFNRAAQPGTVDKPAARPPAFPLLLTAFDRRSCPAAATACVDLARHLTWLQSAGNVSYGPVQMEPGPPGTAHATPHGAFYVSWKAGPGYASTIYHDAMPWATFFAPGGIAFHGGSLTRWSHGCVHLALSAAHYYNTHLPVGAEVVVF